MLCDFCPPADQNDTLNDNDENQKSVCASMEEARALWFATIRTLEKSFGFVLFFACEPHRRGFIPALLLVVAVHYAEADEPVCSLSHNTATRVNSISLLVAYLHVDASS